MSCRCGVCVVLRIEAVSLLVVLIMMVASWTRPASSVGEVRAWLVIVAVVPGGKVKVGIGRCMASRLTMWWCMVGNYVRRVLMDENWGFVWQRLGSWNDLGCVVGIWADGEGPFCAI